MPRQTSTDPPVHVGIPLGAQAPRAARQALTGLRQRAPDDAIDRALVVVSELVTNAFKHSGMAAGEEVQLTLAIDGPCLRVEVADRGGGRAVLDRPRPPRLEAMSGRGLWLVEQLADDWGWRANAGLRVWAEVRW